MANSITNLIKKADSGDGNAANELYCLVEAELKVIAKRRKANFQNDDNETTALINEAFVRLVGKQSTEWETGDRRKFFAYISRKIHHLLIESARARRAKKRGEDAQVVCGDVLSFAPDVSVNDPDLLIDLQGKLSDMQAFAPMEAECFHLRYFLGCTFAEIADLLKVSTSKSKRCVSMAQLWLQKELKGYDHEC